MAADPYDDLPTATDADRAEQAAATTAVVDGRPSPLPESALAEADAADVAEQQAAVPLDEDEYR